MLIRMAFRNLMRNSRRSLLTAGGIALCTFFVILALTHLAGALFTFEEDLLVTTGHIRVVDSEYVRKQRLMSLRWVVDDLANRLKVIRRIPGIREVAPRISCGVMVDIDGERQHSTVCAALDPTLDGERRRLERAIVKGSYAPFLEPPGKSKKRTRRVIAGTKIVEKLGGLDVGDIVTIIFRTRTACIAAANFKICAITDMKANQLNRFVYIPRDDMAELIEMEDRATELLVFANSTWGLERLAKTIKSKINGPNILVEQWKDIGFLGSALDSLYRIFGIVIGVILLVAGIGVGNTMVMAVLERTSEIGVLQALGFRTRQIVFLFLLEGLLLGLVGVVIGSILGIFGGVYLEQNGLDITTSWAQDISLPIRDTMYGRLSPDIVLVAILLGLAVAVGGSVGPALRAARLEPANALRA